MTNENRAAAKKAVAAATPDAVHFSHETQSDGGGGHTVQAEFRSHGATFTFSILDAGAPRPQLTAEIDEVRRVSICPKGKNNISLTFAHGADFFIKVPNKTEQAKIVSWWQAVIEGLDLLEDLWVDDSSPICLREGIIYLHLGF